MLSEMLVKQLNGVTFYLLAFSLAFILLLLDLANAFVNHIVKFVPLSLVRGIHGVDRDDLPPEVTLGAISLWLFVS